MMSRPSFIATDVATDKCCRDLDSLQLMSRPLNDVATSSRFSVDVATSSRCRDLYIQFLEDLMSRLLFGVMTSMSSVLHSILS